jgi:hypothetical protein
MAKFYTKAILMVLIYTICTLSVHANIDSAREASFSASLYYIEGDYKSAGILFRKSLDLRIPEDPIYETLLKLHLYSLWNSSKEEFCSATAELSESEKRSLKSDLGLLELSEECNL